MEFSSIDPKISSEVLEVIDRLGFTKLTPVQAATIPLFLKNKDVSVEATTGSGKTLAFTIPIIELLKRCGVKFKVNDVGALVIAPTRELASQIYGVIEVFCKHHPIFKCDLFVGGNDIKSDIDRFTQHGAHIVIGTPGRILDLYKRCPIFRFNKVEILVLDEADTLLDMGFKETINQILVLLPKQRRTGLFSATQTKEVKDLVRAGLRNPVSICVRVSNTNNSSIKKPLESSEGSNSSSINNNNNKSIVPTITPTTLENYYTLCPYDERPGALLQFIQQHHQDKMIIFCATCACVDYFTLVFNRLRQKKLFNLHTLPMYGFHGKMIPKKRNLIYKKFISLSHGILFSTDVTARGIDIPDVNWIIQLAAPKDPSFFVHRVGRTARAGRHGGALLFLTSDEADYVNLLHGRGVPLTYMQTYIDPSITTTTTDIKSAAMDSHNTYIDISQKEEDNDNDDDVVDRDDEEESDEEEEVDDDDDDNDNNNDDDDLKDTSEQFHTSTTANNNQSSLNTQLLIEMKQCAIEDRTVLEAGSTAFMSFLRAYQEHLCSYIFKFADLDLGAVARMYALLRLPKMPETRSMKGRQIVFETSTIDTSKIKYLHKEKEKARQRKIEARKEEQKNIDKNDSTSLDAEGNTLKIQKSNDDKKWIPSDQYQPPVEEKRIRNKKKTKYDHFQEEWDDLAAEETLYKKYKKGKMNTQEYNQSLLSMKQTQQQHQKDDDHSMEESDSDDDDSNNNDDNNDDDENETEGGNDSIGVIDDTNENDNEDEDEDEDSVDDEIDDEEASGDDKSNDSDDDDSHDNDKDEKDEDEVDEEEEEDDDIKRKAKELVQLYQSPSSSSLSSSSHTTHNKHHMISTATTSASASKVDDEKTTQLVNFWSQKCTKIVKQNKKRTIKLDDKDKDDINNTLIKRPKLNTTPPSSSNSINNRTKSLSSSSSSSYKSKKSNAPPSIMDKLSSKYKQKVNEWMQGGRHAKSQKNSYSHSRSNSKSGGHSNNRKNQSGSTGGSGSGSQQNKSHHSKGKGRH